jgi:hypothetical protein
MIKRHANAEYLKVCAWRGCSRLTTSRHCPTHRRAYRAARQQRPIERVYDSPRWRNETRPAVLERDKRCVVCGSTDRLQAAHLGRTQELLAAGLDVYDPRLAVAVCPRHNRAAAASGLSPPSARMRTIVFFSS